ncbi:MAG TPA: hypothetical protein VK854_05680 [Woeseiaceae bacterium]|nr:hypothetical protein [Woeseiaceae bacterium]
MNKRVLGSLARIADFDTSPFDVVAIPRSEWETGDYVQGEVVGEATQLYTIECTTGEMIGVEKGDRVIGAFGHRAATLEGVGSWMKMDGGAMNAMTSAGLFGRFTSVSRLLPRPLDLEYAGHVLRRGRKVCMRDFALEAAPRELDVPTILMVGTSMSAGKTMVGKFACQILADLGYRVIGTKLTGAGRYRDILSFRNHGAAEVYDFVDAGLPSTVVPENEFRLAIRPLLNHIASRGADFMVVEAGASPLEPYNGAAAIDELGANVHCCILCATDPYAVVGVQKAYGLRPDLVAGPATNTSAALDLVEKLTALPGINIIDPDQLPVFRDFLVHVLHIDAVATRAPDSA